MQAVILVCIQGSGKSKFCRERFYKTHIRLNLVRLNLDMLKTRNRESILLDACLSSKRPFVIDNTNPTRTERARYISRAKDVGFQIVGYYFRSSSGECLPRNDAREGNERVPAEAF